MPVLRRRLILRFFHLLYGPLAVLHDPIAWVVSCGRWWRWGRCALEWATMEGPLLEIGPGTGRLLAHVIADETGRSPSRFVVGVDRSPAMLRRAQRRLNRLKRSAPHAGTAGLVLADARQLPFAAGTFSSTIATFPTPALLTVEAFKEVSRVLSRGGSTAIVLAAAPSGRGPWASVARVVLGASGSSSGRADRATGHVDGTSSQFDRATGKVDRTSGHRDGVQAHPGEAVALRAQAAGLDATLLIRRIEGDQVWLVAATRPPEPESRQFDRAAR